MRRLERQGQGCRSIPSHLGVRDSVVRRAELLTSFHKRHVRAWTRECVNQIRPNVVGLTGTVKTCSHPVYRQRGIRRLKDSDMIPRSLFEG